MDAPEGIVADNAALEISPDGNRVFLAAGSEARFWDLRPAGAVWGLKRLGICDAAAFDPRGRRLFYFRVERQEAAGERHEPDSPEHPDKGHVIGRMRDLLGATPLVALWETPVFRDRVYKAGVARDGGCVVVHSGVDGAEGRSNSLMRRGERNSGR